ncbi:flagellar export protein FliJ [Bartonella bilalgolemii]|uniref:Flagellar export protein FliJ n=1 Tax=Bartonella bilalgolemii TaxID=2942911 RepID=A0ABT0P763_9HYPH|nr:flagellar export protein FliJ [Bartonella sp. G70]MCL6229310.1 flagellar export protein FliJ [Bartonella sp. G70]
MKSRQNMVQLKMFQVREKRREIAQLEMMITEFERIVLELEEQIVSEERRSGNDDVHHFAYSAFARAARQRRDNLTDSIRDLKLQKTNAKITLKEIDLELQRAQMIEKNGDRIVTDDHHTFPQLHSMVG